MGSSIEVNSKTKDAAKEDQDYDPFLDGLDDFKRQV
jgi:hypothetical protein